MRAGKTIPALAVLLVFNLAATGPPNAPELILRSNTRLGQVSVVAAGHRGRPALDLKREDFELFDDKRRREIQVFSIDRVERTMGDARWTS